MAKAFITNDPAGVNAVTHSGNFQADDVFAAARLASTSKIPFNIFRTRDEEYLTKWKEDASVTVFDVGGEYDVSLRNFDHHQRPRPERLSGLPWSSFGLITTPEQNPDSMLCCHIDSIDNGVKGYPAPKSWQRVIDIVGKECKIDFNGKPPSIGWLIHMCNPCHLDGSKVQLQEFNIRFEVLVNFLIEKVFDENGFEKPFCEREVAEFFIPYVLFSKYCEEASRNRVKSVIDECNSEVIVLDQYEPAALDVVAEGDNGILYVVYPGPTNWMVQQVAAKPGSFEGRKPLPKEWSGKRGKELAEITGVEDAVFCHTGCFIGGADSKEGAVKLAELAVKA